MGILEYPNRRSPAVDAVDAYLETFFACREVVNPDGSGVMVDSVRNATYKPSAEVGATLVNGTDTLTNTLVPTITNSVPLTSGVWPNFRQRSIVTFAFGKVVDPTQVRTPIGQGDGDSGYPNSLGGAISLSLASFPHMIVNAATSQIFTLQGTSWAPLQVGQEVGVVVEYQPSVIPSARALMKIILADGSVVTNGGNANEKSVTHPNAAWSAASADVNPGNNNKTRFEGLALYGFAAFSFPDALPTRAILDAAYVEMMDDWKKGNRKAPSQFRYLTQIP